MDVGRNIISTVLGDTNSLKLFVDAGFNLKWMTDPHDLSRVAIFGDHTEQYLFILRWYDKHLQAPSREYFQHNFPTQTYGLIDDPAPIDELLAVASEDRLRARLHVRGSEFVDLFDEGDYAGALEIMQRTAQELRVTADPELFRLRTLTDLADMPDPEPRVEDILDQATVTLVSGFAGTGKSFLALDWAAHIAAGEPWFEHKVRQGNVLYVAAEGAWGMKKRIAAWQRRYTDLKDDQFLFVIDPVQLGDDAHVEVLARMVREHAIDFVVFDTLSRCTAGMEENAAKDMAIAIGNAYKIRDTRGEGQTDVLIVHHSGYETKRSRGSTALPANVDNVYQVTAEDPHTEFILSTTKRKDGPPHPDMSLQLEEVRGSCVVAEGPGESIETGPSLLMLLKPDIGQTVAELAAQMDLSKQAVTKQLKALKEKGLARVEVRAGRKGADIWQKYDRNE
jgi:biotin operon repressor